VLSSSVISDIGWQYSSSVNNSANQTTAPTPNDSANQSSGSFQSALAQATGSPSSDQVTSAPNAGSPRGVSDTKPQDKKSPVKSSARTEPVQRAVKAEPSTLATQGAVDSARSVGIADNVLAPALASGQLELPANPSPSPANDKSGSAVLASLTGPRPSAASLAPAAGFSSLKDLSGAAFAVHITSAVNNPGAANQGSGGQGNADQNASPNDPNQAFPASNSATNNSLLAMPKAAAADTLSLQPSMPVSMTTPVWMSSESAATTSQSSAASPDISTSVEVNEIQIDGAAGAPQTVRTVQVQLTAGEGQGRVDLRLVEHAGGLSVSVRSSDATLTKDLQENLPDLSARLAADKYQTHTFIPPASEAAGGGSSSGSSEQPSGQGQHDAGGRSSSQGGDANGQQKDGQPSPQEAAWWRQLAALGKLSSSASYSVSGSPLSSVANPVANQ
jgi:hypothetical protein